MTLTAVPAAICIPVRDEEAALPDLLDALAGLETTGLQPMAVFHLDSCTDRSADVLRAAAVGFPMPVTVTHGAAHPDANAGRARRAALAPGLDHLRDRPRAILLTTDADSRPRHDWLIAAACALEIADVAAGEIVGQGAGGGCGQTRIELYYDRLHALRRAIDPVAWEPVAGRHFGGGANLAFTAAAYARLGGFRPLPSGEDAALLDDAARAGFRVRRDRAMVVETSSRRHGRAPGGLADALRTIDRAGLPDVAHPAAAVWQYRAQAEARRAFDGAGEPAVAGRLGLRIGLSADHVIGVARDCPNAEAFAMRVVPAAPEAAAIVPLPVAEQALAVLEQTLREDAA